MATWGAGGGGFGGGFGGNMGAGFMNTSQVDSPLVQGEKKERRSQNLVPVTIRTILESPSDTVKISQQEVQLVSVVGIVLSVEVSSTKHTYVISDCSGKIEAHQYLDADREADGTSSPLVEMTYCRAIGVVRSLQGKRYIMIFRIMPVTDFNFVTTHILEVMHALLKAKQIDVMAESGNVGATDGSSVMSTSMVTGNFGGGPASFGVPSGMVQGLTPAQNLVYQCIVKNTIDESGPHRSVIHSSLKSNISHTEVDKIIEFLSGEGHIYSTIDDDHYKSTDN